MPLSFVSSIHVADFSALRSIDDDSKTHVWGINEAVVHHLVRTRNLSAFLNADYETCLQVNLGKPDGSLQQYWILEKI